MPSIQERGASLVAISPLLPEKAREIHTKYRLGFPLLADKGNRYAKELGLTFTLPEDLQKIYADFGINLPDHQGGDQWTLPLPARIVLSTGGIVRAIDADPDYTHRPEPTATLEVLRQLSP